MRNGAAASKKIILVGSPNSGKSALFGAITGSYATVSNYPGTTVEITAGTCTIGAHEYEIIDTPGMYSMVPITEEERIARDVLDETEAGVVVHVIDAKNLERALHLSVQLIEAGLPIVIALNIIDEATKLGWEFDIPRLSAALGVPVLPTVAVKREGIPELLAAINRRHLRGKPASAVPVEYNAEIESFIANFSHEHAANGRLNKRAKALLWLQEHTSNEESAHTPTQAGVGTAVRTGAHLDYAIATTRQEFIAGVVGNSLKRTKGFRISKRERLGKAIMQPAWGIPLMLLVLYGFYLFVGVIGAGKAVGFLENTLFGKYLSPPLTKWVESVLPWTWAQDLFVHDYGIFTLGIRYAFAIIFPIVTTFFIAFSVLEDSGYLPRCAMLIDGLFKKIGLSGRAVIPMLLGFGCGTMATLVTRTLETKRERVLATFLLSLSIPCSAQMGVIFALLSGNTLYFWIFTVVMVGVFLLSGMLAARLVPGARPLFYMEIPPLRRPSLANIFLKTYTRLVWYFKEVLPLFIIASILIWAGHLTGIFGVCVKALSYPVQWIGLPAQAAPAFLYGFFRRDFGAAGLYDLKTSGAFSGFSVVVASITIALFMPCIAQVSITIKERGWKMALGMAAFIFPFAFFIGFLVHTAATLVKGVL